MGLIDRVRAFLAPPVVERIPTVTFEGCGYMPSQHHRGDAGWDVYTSEPVLVPPNKFVDIPCGIRIDIPEGYWVRITGRSSTVRTWRLQVQEGIIDQGYTGPIFVGVWNLTDEPINVPEGTRLAQVIFSRTENIRWERGKVREKGRGNRGFGSTGR